MATGSSTTSINFDKEFNRDCVQITLVVVEVLWQTSTLVYPLFQFTIMCWIYT